MLLLTLKAGPNRYAIDVARVIELVPRVELRTIPHAPPFLAGLLGYRGSVIPVIDLGLLLNSAPCPDRLHTRIILVSDAPDDHNSKKDGADSSSAPPAHFQREPASDPYLLGLIGEQVSDLTYVQLEQLMPAPVQLRNVPFLSAIVQTEAGIIQLIAVERIREASLAGYIPNRGAAYHPQASEVDEKSRTHEESRADD